MFLKWKKNKYRNLNNNFIKCKYINIHYKYTTKIRKIIKKCTFILTKEIKIIVSNIYPNDKSRVE